MPANVFFGLSLLLVATSQALQHQNEINDFVEVFKFDTFLVTLETFDFECFAGKI